MGNTKQRQLYKYLMLILVNLICIEISRTVYNCDAFTDLFITCKNFWTEDGNRSLTKWTLGPLISTTDL